MREEARSEPLAVASPTRLWPLALVLVLAAGSGACGDPDGTTLGSVFGDEDDPPPTVTTDTSADSALDAGADTVDAAVDAAADTVRPDIVLEIPPGACASLVIEVDGEPVREASAVRCEVGRQTWRGSEADEYLTVVLESEVAAEPDASGAYVRDLVQLVIDDVALAPAPIEQRDYELRYEQGTRQSFAVYSGSSAWVASSGDDPASWGEPRGTVTLLADDGSRGRFAFEATLGGVRYLVRGDFAASPAAGRLPEPAVR